MRETVPKQKYPPKAQSSSPVVMTGASVDEAAPLILSHHYSRRLPANIQHVYAVREPGGLFGDTGDPLAVAVFSVPPRQWRESVLELSRLVRKPAYDGQLSSLLSFSCNALRRKGYTLLVSYADSTQQHHGGIYQASSWRFHGKRKPNVDGLFINDTFYPGRSSHHKWGTRSVTKLLEIMPDAEITENWDEGKYLYWKPLNKRGKAKAKRLELQEMPYPKPENSSPAVPL